MPRPPDTKATREGRTIAGAALRLSDVRLSFGGIGALKGVDLEVQAGEIHAVIGPNGAGKSSLVNVICGVYTPQKGTIVYAGQPIRRIRPERLARLGITRTFQNLALFKGLSVIDNVILGLSETMTATVWEEILGAPRARRQAAAARSRALQVLRQLDLASLQDAAVHTLPYGVQKRVELARAIIGAPRLLLLDEPMAGMTEDEKASMSRFIRAVHAATGTTIILIEHDMAVIMDLSDHITVLDHGRHIAHGTPTEIAANPDVIDAYLGVAHADDGDDDATEVLAA
ncbi:ABC transporter ATP-binding protein [Acidisoma sp. 7E03]